MAKPWFLPERVDSPKLADWAIARNNIVRLPRVEPSS
jgi:hypothetical protein